MKTSRLIPLLLFLSLLGCKEPQMMVENLPPLINPPIPEMDPLFDVQTISAEEGAILRYETGSVVVIPPAALVDREGNPVAGNVEISFREFHDAADILLSGIPMDYDSAGVKQQFQTAGMFELRAHQNGEALFLEKGSMAQVKLASNETEDNYNFYRLNEEARGWQYEGQRSPEVNSNVLEIRNKIDELEAVPGKMRRFGWSPFAFNYEGLLDIYFKENQQVIYDNWNSPGTKAKVLLKAKAYGLDCLDFTVYQDIEWEGRRVPACMMVWDHLGDKPFPEWVSKNSFRRLVRFDGDIYRLTMRGPKELQYYMTWIQPVMTLKELYAVPPAGWTEQSDEIKKMIAEEEARLKEEAAVMRTFEIAEFGVYNWDRFLKEEDPIPVLADFDFGGSVNELMTEPVVFYLPGDNRSVVKMPKFAWNNFAVVNDPKARMVSILPGPRIAFFSRKKYREIDREELRLSPEKPAYTFVMEDIGALRSQAHLKTILGM